MEADKSAGYAEEASGVLLWALVAFMFFAGGILLAAGGSALSGCGAGKPGGIQLHSQL